MDGGGKLEEGAAAGRQLVTQWPQVLSPVLARRRAGGERCAEQTADDPARGEEQGLGEGFESRFFLATEPNGSHPRVGFAGWPLARAAP